MLAIGNYSNTRQMLYQHFQMIFKNYKNLLSEKFLLNKNILFEKEIEEHPNADIKR